MSKIVVFAICVVFAGCIFLGAVSSTSIKNGEIAQRGCCSHHSGVCGCQYGRIVCCDGSYSPSCHCMHDDFTTKPNI